MKLLIAAFGFAVATVHAAETPLLKDEEIQNSLAHRIISSTFMIRGPSGVAGLERVGTAFILVQRLRNNPSTWQYILVTADHVLRQIQGNTASLLLRRTDKVSSAPCLFPFPIRDSSSELWTRHPGKQDVAAMFLELPTGYVTNIVPTEFLADDEQIKRFHINPGDRAFAVGFPQGRVSNTFGFPIIRSGHIASFPLLPTRETKSLLVDMSVFSGNSGGPVFLNEQGVRYYDGSSRIGVVRIILGLVSASYNFPQVVRTQKGDVGEFDFPMGAAVVVHASAIRDTIADLNTNPAHVAAKSQGVCTPVYIPEAVAK